MSEELVKATSNKIKIRKNEISIAIISIFMGLLLGSVAGWFSVNSTSLEFLFVCFGFLFLLVSFYKPLWGVVILIGFFLSPALFSSEEITSLEIFWGVLFLVGFVGALLRAFLQKKRLLLSFKSEAILWLALFFLVWGAASLLLSLREGESVIWWLREYVDFIGYFLIFWLVWSISKKDEKKWVKILLGLFLGIGVIKGLQQLVYYYQYFPEAIAINNFQILRRGSYAEFFGFPCSILAMCFYVYSKKQREKLLFIFLALFFLLFLVLSFTRSIWIGFAVSFLILLFKIESFRAKIIKVVSYLSMVIIVVMVGGFFLRREIIVYLFNWLKIRFLSFFKVEAQLSILDRFSEWKALWLASWEKPLFGHGIGSGFTFYSVNPWSWVREGGLGLVTIRYSHNAYLYLFYTVGIVGLSLFIMLIFSIIKKARLLQSASSDPFVKAYSTAIHSILYGFLITAIATPIFIGKITSVYIGLLIGIFAVLNRRHLLQEAKHE